MTIMPFCGAAGAGQSMLAPRLTTTLPAVRLADAFETRRIHRVAGLTGARTTLVTTRPFRAPHHTISDAGLIGDGHIPMPGEVLLAHNGVLFLDELPEFRRHVLEVLRQPQEQGVVYRKPRGRPGSSQFRRVSCTPHDLSGLRRRVVAAHYACDRHHVLSGSSHPPLQHLRPSRACRSTTG